MRLEDLRQLSENVWEIPRTFREGMQVPVRLFATRSLLMQIVDDKSLDQAVNAAMLPGAVGAVIVMPDMHQGYGFPIGGVSATEWPHGSISPGAIGYDINCGVRLLASRLEAEAIRADLEILSSRLQRYCPSGVGKAGPLSLHLADLDRILRDGSVWALQNGYASEADLVCTEDGGRIQGARPENVSERAKTRGRQQVGSLGAGNHFIEVDIVDEVIDRKAAADFGLQPGCVAVQIHCGSRGLGHQVCTDYVQRFQAVTQKYHYELPDRELAWAPLDSPEGGAYLGAMRAAANFAFCNRQLLAHSVRRAFEETFRGLGDDSRLVQVYDVAHNMGKIEEHEIAGNKVRVCIQRKGATRAFGPGSPDLPPQYRLTGQPVLVPGSMGTASWVLAGTAGSMEHAFGSACHGAGRVWSRSRAKREIRGDALRNELESQGIHIQAGSMPGLAEEAPSAYKDVDEVVDVVVSVGIARKVARLRPLAVIKG